jgi:flagellar motor switch protein FliN/FliY
MDQTMPEPVATPAPNLPSGVAAGESSDAPRANGLQKLLATLPSHVRRLLKINVPVTVTLATQRKPIQEILELGPGSIVKFDKTCDEPLELMVGERVIATGEVVKVGDKFGLRVGARQ